MANENDPGSRVPLTLVAHGDGTTGLLLRRIEKLTAIVREYFESEDSCCPSCSSWPHEDFCYVKAALGGQL